MFILQLDKELLAPRLTQRASSIFDSAFELSLLNEHLSNLVL